MVWNCCWHTLLWLLVEFVIVWKANWKDWQWWKCLITTLYFYGQVIIASSQSQVSSFEKHTLHVSSNAHDCYSNKRLCHELISNKFHWNDKRSPYILNVGLANVSVVILCIYCAVILCTATFICICFRLLCHMI